MNHEGSTSYTRFRMFWLSTSPGFLLLFARSDGTDGFISIRDVQSLNTATASRATHFYWKLGHQRDHPEQTNRIMYSYGGTVVIRCHFWSITWNLHMSLIKMHISDWNLYRGIFCPPSGNTWNFYIWAFRQGAKASHSVHFRVTLCRKPYHIFKDLGVKFMFTSIRMA